MFAGLPDSAGPIPPEGLAAHARVAEALGTPGLGDVLLEALAQVVPVDEVVAFTWAAPGRPPTIVASAGIGGRAPRRAAAYGSRYFALDPVMQAFGTLGTAAPLLAARVDAAEIADLEYRQACYREPGFVEKVSVAGRTARGWTVLSAFRRAPRGRWPTPSSAGSPRPGRCCCRFSPSRPSWRRPRSASAIRGWPA